MCAHLFGARLNLDLVCTLARRHNLFLIEDCAQAFDGPTFSGHPEAGASLFSFGPLKTSTALGGALLRIRDPELAGRMRSLQSEYPVQGQVGYLNRLLKFGAFTIITSSRVFGLVVGMFRFGGQDYEDAISDKVREVASLGSVKKIAITHRLRCSRCCSDGCEAGGKANFLLAKKCGSLFLVFFKM